ncbi:MAG: TonB-dependent receptor, partial [Bacteroidota bacterium]
MKFSASMHKTGFIIFFLLLFRIAFAQEVTILNLDTQEPVLNVAVYNLDKSKTALTDINGKCDLSIFERNERLTLKHLSYQTRKATKSQLLRRGG